MRFDRDDFGSSVEDRGQGSGGGMGFGGGGGGGMPGMLIGLIISRFGIGGIIVVVILMAVFGGFGNFFGGGGSGVVAPGGSSGPVNTNIQKNCTKNDTYRFACNVYGSTERVWTQLFQASGQSYRPPTLNFYQGGTTSGCGSASSAIGPFYCPADQGVYIDTSFFDELANRFQAPGDFGAAYVIAHEVGHHIQTITGISNRIRQAQSGASEAQSNRLQVRMELQADCLAGAWAANVNLSGDALDAGDLEEGMRAAEAIGDDTLQRSAGRAPVEDSFTHGTSAQRMEALRRGFDGRSLQSCQAYMQGI